MKRLRISIDFDVPDNVARTTLLGQITDATDGWGYVVRGTPTIEQLPLLELIKGGPNES